MDKKFFIAGNWKMYKTCRGTRDYFDRFGEFLNSFNFSKIEIMLAPSFTSLFVASQILKEKGLLNNLIYLGSQNACWEKEGAFTGEISPEMLKELEVRFVIIGHSERRHIFGETNEIIKKRVKGVYESGLIPILCVGETLEEREKGEAFRVVENQLKEGLKELKDVEAERLLIAYEPVWAIGTGKTATPEQAEEVHKFIRDVLSDLFGKDTSFKMRILYGGSVKPKNVEALLSQENIDGVLVGGASLSPEKFFEICKKSEGIA